MQLDKLLEEVSAVAQEAGALMRGDGGFTIETKPGSANYVTSMDVACQKLAIKRLTPLLPGAHFYAEEQELNRLHSGYNWIIDPIDGTTNFIHGCNRSAVSIGLVLDGAAVLGAVYNPYAGELFTAVKGGGAFLNGAPIHAASRSLEKSLVVFGTSPYHREMADALFAAAKDLFLAGNDLRRTGSAALDLCAVAAGRFDAVFEPGLSPWDYAASAVILTEAGGVIGAFSGEYSYERPTCVYAGNAVNGAEVLAHLKRYF